MMKFDSFKVCFDYLCEYDYLEIFVIDKYDFSFIEKFYDYLWL